MKTPDSTDPWEDLFRQRLDDYQDEPPAEALNRILAGIRTDEIVSVGQPTSRFRWISIGAFTLLLMLGGGLWLVSEKQPYSLAKLGSSDTPVTEKVVGIRPGMAATAPEKELKVNNAKGVLNANKTQKASQQPQERPEEVSVERTPADMAEKEGIATEIAENATSTALIIAENKNNKPLTQKRYRRVVEVNRPTSTAAWQTASVPAYPNGTQPGTVPSPTYAQSTIDKNTTEFTDAPMVLATTNANQSLAPLTRLGTTELGVRMTLPSIVFATKAPEQSRKIIKPSWMVALMPMYTFRQIKPNTTDDVYVRQVNTPGALSTDRVGWRFQVGTEWPLSKKVSLRTSVVYSQLQQTVEYAIRPAKQDSVVVDLLDEQTIRFTPVFVDQTKTQTNTWHYAGLSADVLWRVGTGKRWQYFMTAGTSGGSYLGPVRRITGFYQASFGVERPVSDGLWLRIEPSLQYGWNAITDRKELFLIRPYTYGFTIGLRY